MKWNCEAMWWRISDHVQLKKLKLQYQQNCITPVFRFWYKVSGFSFVFTRNIIGQGRSHKVTKSKYKEKINLLMSVVYLTDNKKIAWTKIKMIEIIMLSKYFYRLSFFLFCFEPFYFFLNSPLSPCSTIMHFDFVEHPIKNRQNSPKLMNQILAYFVCISILHVFKIFRVT